MHKTPVQDDYGGNNYGGRKRVRRRTETRESMHCLSCGTMRYVLKAELRRASHPRCLACGGCLERTDAETKRHKHENESMIRAKAYRCRACGSNLGEFRAQNLVAHLQEAADCRQYFAEEGYVMPCGTIFGTLYIGRDGKGKFTVEGLNVSGKTTCLSRHERYWQASGQLQQMNDEFVERRKDGSIA